MLTNPGVGGYPNPGGRYIPSIQTEIVRSSHIPSMELSCRHGRRRQLLCRGWYCMQREISTASFCFTQMRGMTKTAFVNSRRLHFHLVLPVPLTFLGAGLALQRMGRNCIWSSINMERVIFTTPLCWIHICAMAIVCDHSITFSIHHVFFILIPCLPRAKYDQLQRQRCTE